MIGGVEAKNLLVWLEREMGVVLSCMVLKWLI